MVKILVKRLNKNIKLPVYKTSGSSGMDIAANLEKIISIRPGKSALIPTGIMLAIPKILKYKLDLDLV